MSDRVTAFPAARFLVDFPSSSPLISQWCTREEAMALLERYPDEGATLYIKLPLGWQAGGVMRFATHAEMLDAANRGAK